MGRDGWDGNLSRASAMGTALPCLKVPHVMWRPFHALAGLLFNVKKSKGVSLTEWLAGGNFVSTKDSQSPPPFPQLTTKESLMKIVSNLPLQCSRKPLTLWMK